VGDVDAVAKLMTHAPSAAAKDVTPVASSTVVVHAPVPTEAACAGLVKTLMQEVTRTAEQARTVRRITSII